MRCDATGLAVLLKGIGVMAHHVFDAGSRTWRIPLPAWKMCG
jgi:hypothetical protein